MSDSQNPWKDDPRTCYLVEVQMHTAGAKAILDHPEHLKDIVGSSLELIGLVEGVDVSIQVDRAMPMIRGVRQ